MLKPYGGKLVVMLVQLWLTSSSVAVLGTDPIKSLANLLLSALSDNNEKENKS